MIDYSSLLSDRIKRVKPSGIRKYFDLAERTEGVISLGVGEPDFNTPWHIREAGIRSIELGRTRYTSNAGLLELRRGISEYLDKKIGVDYNFENEILVTVGGSEAIDGALRVLLNPGDEVLIPEPSFVCYTPLTEICGGVPVPIQTKSGDCFRLTREDLESAINEKTKVLILPFPNNPTGGVMRRRHLLEIADVLKGTSVIVIADEIYGELTYGGEPHVSLAGLPGMRERTVIVSGFSKSYSMTGWRMGFAAGPVEIISEMTKLHQFSIMCAPTTAQYAALEAIRRGEDDIKRMREEYDMRRRLLVSEIQSIGLDCFMPEGAFYAFPSIKKTGMTSDEFCQRLITEQKVAVVPGSAFGDTGEGFVRISYSYSPAHLTEAVSRMKRFLDKV